MTDTVMSFKFSINASVHLNHQDLHSSEEDTPTWGLTNNGHFSTGCMYNLLRDQESMHQTQRDFSLAWRANTSNKIKIFLWLMLHNRLPTNAYLSHIGLSIPSYYHHFQDQEETIDYIFFKCPNVILF